MSKSKGPKHSKKSDARRPIGPWILGVLLTVLVGGGVFLTVHWLRRETGQGLPSPGAGSQEIIAVSTQQRNIPRQPGHVTFCKDVATIVWKRCTPCHRPGQAAPFELLTYADVKRRIKQIAEVTAKRIMPPWLPEPGYGEFAGSRRLSAEELGLLQQWIAEGATEGETSDLPAAPVWAESWFLGSPDLIVTMPQPYTLPPEGRDVYRNFVLPIPLPGRRFVRAVEMRPGNARIVHHAFMYLDRTRQSRRLASRESEPGFPRMETPESARMPSGQILTYQPGKFPSFAPSGLAWVLEKDTDLVLQVHLNPTGKPELLQASVGFYFTEEPPTNTPFKVLLTSGVIEIPAGESNYKISDSFTLPVEASLIAVLPHAHYLAREMRGNAALPDGTIKPLLWIKDWDFKWQGDYQYAQPVWLPRGTVLRMDFTYDNSTNNFRNPNHPPKPVSYGAQSVDEMAELSFQLLVRNESDRDSLARAHASKMQRALWDRATHDLRKDPNNVQAHVTYGQLLSTQKRAAEALEHLNLAIRIDPNCQEAYFDLGVVLMEMRKFSEAKSALERAIELDPDDYRAQGSLGHVCLQLGLIRDAVEHLQMALHTNPDDAIARQSLERIKRILTERAKGQR